MRKAQEVRHLWAEGVGPIDDGQVRAACARERPYMAMYSARHPECFITMTEATKARCLDQKTGTLVNSWAHYLAYAHKHFALKPKA